jgi:hypothetical protein
MRTACRREKPTRFVRLHLETFPRPDAEHGPLIGPDHFSPWFSSVVSPLLSRMGCGGEPPSLGTVTIVKS